jgi:hypothetical protein
MRLWSLKPLDVKNRNRAASTYRDEVIVRADSERSARRLAARAFGIATNVVPGEKIRFVPWDSSDLVRCSQVAPSATYPEQVSPLLSALKLRSTLRRINDFEIPYAFRTALLSGLIR